MPGIVLSTLYGLPPLVLQHSYDTGPVLILILEMRKLRIRRLVNSSEGTWIGNNGTLENARGLL